MNINDMTREQLVAELSSTGDKVDLRRSTLMLRVWVEERRYRLNHK